jgi:hypothetical protein
MVERLGHTVHNNPTAAALVTTKQGQKYVIACATPSDPGPTAMRDIARLHDAVIAQTAQRGIYVTARNFTHDAKDYAASMPAVIQLVDGAKLAQLLEMSNAGVVCPTDTRPCVTSAGRSSNTTSITARPCPASTGTRSRPRLRARRWFENAARPLPSCEASTAT